MTPQQQKLMELSLETSKNTLTALKLANEQGAIADTIWLSKYETLFDYIESQIDAMQRILVESKEPKQETFMASYEFKQYGYYKDEKGTLKLGNIQVPQPPQRTWVGLTDDEIDQGLLRSDYAFKTAEAWRAGVVFAMTKLKEKNNA